jgi:ligand-binding sensor domain-containing protein/signal transduction histidine kinase
MRPGRRGLIFGLLTLLMQIHQLSGQVQQFTHYKVQDGLSQSEILCIFQDSEGFMWFGTQNGLNKFDGYTFEPFFNDPADSTTLSNNWIFAITEDQNGNIWIGTKSGLNRYDKKTRRFSTFALRNQALDSRSNYIYGLWAEENFLYINHAPLISILDVHSGELTTYQSNLETGGALYDNGLPILKTRDEKIWIGSANGLCTFDQLTGEFSNIRVSHPHITSLLEDRNGRVLIGTEYGLNIYEPFSDEISVVLHDPDKPYSLSNNYIQSMVLDHRGALWIGTDGGGLNHTLELLPSESARFVHFRNLADNKRFIGHDIVISLFEDQSRNLWIGTLAGVDKTDLKERHIRTFQKSDDPHSLDLLDNVIASVYEDDQGQLWVGTWGKGMSIFDPKGKQATHYKAEFSGNKHIPENHVHVIFKDSKSRIWLGTRNGVSIRGDGSERFVPVADYFNAPEFDYFTNNRVYCILEARDGKFWIGTGNGICILDTEQKERTILRESGEGTLVLSRNLIYSLLEDRDGWIWIATSNGLDRYEPESKRIRHYVSDPDSDNSLVDNYTISLCEDPGGNIWIGTSGGLSKFDKSDSSFTNYTLFDGLPSNIIYDILLDDNDNLWFTTGSGLVMKNPAIISVEDFEVIDELAGKEFNLKAVCKGKKGDLYFGGIDGLTTFHPDSLTSNDYLPPVHITSIVKENEHFSQSLSAYADQIEVSHKDYSLMFEFSALDYTNPSRNRYQYKMEGISDQWIDIGTRPFVPFTNLPPGDYVFRVIGTNSDGLWNRQGASMPVTILPPWWRSNLAYALYIIFLLMSILLTIYLRERNLVREKRVLEEKIRERTTEIADKNRSLEEQRDELNELNATKDRFFSILAHDLKNPFSSLYSLSELAVDQYEHMEENEKLLTLQKINQSSELIYKLLENLLTWSRSQRGDLDYSPELFNLSALAEVNLNLHRLAAEKKKIRLVSEMPEDLKVFADREMINTVIRNLVNNAVKYSHPGGSVELRILQKDPVAEIRVRDEGTGISPENLEKIFRIDTKFKLPGTGGEKGTGLGLTLCRDFVEKNAGRIRAESIAGEGTTFIVTIPLSAS